MAMMAIAGFMNGLIAYGIEKNMNGVHGWASWRWLFLIEGISKTLAFFLSLLPK